MNKKFLLVITLLLCSLCCFSACQEMTSVNNDLISPSPIEGEGQTATNTTTIDSTQTPNITDGTVAPSETGGPVDTATPTPTVTQNMVTPTKTATKTPTKRPTATPTDTKYTLPYVIYVNRTANVVTIYRADEAGNPLTAIKAMLCSTGRNNGTGRGTFYITDKYEWRALFGDVYGQYACRFNGNVLFHSVPYLKKDKSTLKPGEFNKLGTQASDGCVRLSVADCKWIYDYCASGTKVVVYASQDPGPLGKPSAITIPDDAGWDPTDPDMKNPWITEIPVLPVTFSGISSNVVELQRNGTFPNLHAGITAKDGIGMDVTSRITISHTINMQKVGTYLVTYKVTNGNTGLYNCAVVTYQVVDKTAPIIRGLSTSYRTTADAMTHMTKDWLLKGVKIIDDGEQIDVGTVSLTINGQEYTPELLMAGAENRVLLRVSDGNGNTTETEIVIGVTAVTTQPPTITPTPEATEMPKTTETPIVTTVPDQAVRANAI